MKTPLERCAFYNQLQYSVILKRHGNDFVVQIPDLALIASDADLNQAYQRLDSMRTEYIKKMVECGCEDDIVLPRQVKMKRGHFQWRFLSILFAFSLFVCFSAGVFYFVQEKLVVAKNDVREKVLRIPSRVRDRLQTLQPEQIDKYGKILLGFLQRARPTVRELCAYFYAINAEVDKDPTKT